MQNYGEKCRKMDYCENCKKMVKVLVEDEKRLCSICRKELKEKREGYLQNIEGLQVKKLAQGKNVTISKRYTRPATQGVSPSMKGISKSIKM